MAPIESYPRYTKASVAPSPCVPPRPLLALRRPPPATAPPAPERPALAAPAGYTRSVHAAPAAWPKTLKEGAGALSRSSTPFGPAPAPNGADGNGEGKAERAARIVREKDVCVSARRDATYWPINEAEAGGQPAQWLSVERWTRDIPAQDGITLVVAHANGIQKELYHPMMAGVIEQTGPGALFGSGAPLPSGPGAPVINDIWFLDDAHHGASVDLNAGLLGPVYAWADCARDVANFVLHVLPAVRGSAYQMEWSDTAPVTPVVGVGHSIGGNALVQAAAMCDAFSALLLIEPMCQPAIGNVQIKLGHPIVQGALRRRASWPSLSSAASVRNNAMFASWSDQVFALYLATSLVPGPDGTDGVDGGVTLATPTWAEAAVFADPEGPQHGWDALPRLQCPVGFVLGDDQAWLGGPKVVPEIPWRAPRSRNERLRAGSHLLPQEAPEQCAQSVCRFLCTLEAGVWDVVGSKL
ncbi:hypothetical protein CspeluHIS016_0202020 [Cutaneotrichosporon spelunceum]|uniref:AB hydrolase-1 domain-containing protein n=1 Tax=Cutaneotrichosporon spelunceum TaxID=1672016 RepID=A0AAD3Y9Q2_9TREE|nr:hypothetical protein CspeluHIS016_0202020 [Cutaneotrichosporon spelunceum]